MFTVSCLCVFKAYLKLRRPRCLSLLGGVALLFPTTCLNADFTIANSARELAELSLEELMNETVTSVSKWEERRMDAASAVSLLTREEIRQSAALSLPEVLRDVPGVNVAAINASDYAVSIRGFNNIFANKLLVLVDGRSVYTPSFGGVFWDLQAPMLEDLDRIEIIRGPGASIWGANAVNGVINVVSRDAEDTQGGYLYAGTGELQDYLTGARYGDRIGSNTFYRIFASAQSHDGFPGSDPDYRSDRHKRQHAGFRMDHHGEAGTHVTWQGDYTEIDAPVRGLDSYNANTLGRWSRTLADDSSLVVQSYFDHTYRYDPARVESTVDMFDITIEHAFDWTATNRFIWGTGYRHIVTEAKATNPFALMRDGTFNEALYNAFLQNEWSLVPDKLILTAGCKIEHNDYTGFEYQPTLRGLYKLSEYRSVWASVSRAVRTPSQTEGRDFLILGEPRETGLSPIVMYGNENLGPEVLWAYEAGYRSQIGQRIDMDVTVFYHDYDHLISVETFAEARPIPDILPGYLGVQWTNSYKGHNYGLEGSLTMAVSEDFQISAHYSYLYSKVNGERGGPISPEDFSESAPRHQGSLAGIWRPNGPFEASGQLRYVGGFGTVSSYLTADLFVSYAFSEGLEVILGGRNLLKDAHEEQPANAPYTPVSEVTRNLYVKAVLSF